MSANKAFGLVVGLILLALIEGLIKAVVPTFPIEAVLGFQTGISGGILMTKLIHDVNEMKHANGKIS